VVKDSSLKTSQVSKLGKPLDETEENSKINERKSLLILVSQTILPGVRNLTKKNQNALLQQLVGDVVEVMHQIPIETSSHIVTLESLREIHMLLTPSISSFQVWTRRIRTLSKEASQLSHQEVEVSEEVETKICLETTSKISQLLTSTLTWTMIFL